MNEIENSACQCLDCPGDGCNCGCQSNIACACAPACNCGTDCQCGPSCACGTANVARHA